eukprot:gnl/MRDRNA2_/MRDRNA2_75485_c0_seq1.p1 gnl/MRDRNA2_/MRDRNA2_75485_c0~~gnl/MRDRNA2_/MRDRNA2_75485_c0_seq1.p1  ORF type:complete len:355 (+),score=60.29 gnl/MRDRNA2_/MRDRNA2_75485_c0_seq1:55-1119(+)
MKSKIADPASPLVEPLLQEHISSAWCDGKFSALLFVLIASSFAVLLSSLSCTLDMGGQQPAAMELSAQSSNHTADLMSYIRKKNDLKSPPGSMQGALKALKDGGVDLNDKKYVLGIDIGGSGIKGGLVDTSNGTMITERFRMDTIHPATPKSVADQVKTIVSEFNWKGPVGCGIPAVVQQGVVRTAANIDRGWIGTDGEALMSEVTGCKVRLINDADAAGLVEVRFGAGRDAAGKVLMVTLGTGIGTAFFNEGKLFPNAEWGHLIINGSEAESLASDRARQQGDLDWPVWAARVDHVLHTYCDLLWPDLIILSGGVSKKSEHYLHLLTQRVPVVTAKLSNVAGIVGAAIWGSER